MNATHKNGWYVVYTRPKHEKKVFDELVFLKYNAYFPIVKKVSVWSDRKKVVEKPLFPSYIFVYLDNALSYYKILQIKGTVTFIQFENKPAVVKDIEIIKLLIEHCSNVELSNSDIKIGEMKKIISGPLSGYDCKIVSFNGKSRICVEIESLNQIIVAELKYSHLVIPDYI
jgi:transcription antitermination factor NusG